ncbi:MAG: hypothetical protein E7211_20545 [Clostridium lundense]|nr:hypothetical protein [Clostridium lundense]
MINDIVVGIAQALNAEFGDNYEIYCEEVEQDLKEPCFLITLLEATNRQIVGNRYMRTHPFAIQYFPSISNKKSECNDVQDRLYSALEYIDFQDGMLKGTSMNGSVVDGVLHFMVDYNFTVIKVEDKVYMESLKFKGKVNV